jgi:1,4-alpha-glucan branching enzyme
MTTILDDGRIEFRFFRPQAHQVCLAGCFTHWQAGAIPMTSDGKGWWTLTLDLTAGDYKFRYLADGGWFTDYAAFGLEYRKNIWNSLLFVPETERTETRTERTPMRLAA